MQATRREPTAHTRPSGTLLLCITAWPRRTPLELGFLSSSPTRKVPGNVVCDSMPVRFDRHSARTKHEEDLAVRVASEWHRERAGLVQLVPCAAHDFQLVTPLVALTILRSWSNRDGRDGGDGGSAHSPGPGVSGMAGQLTYMGRRKTWVLFRPGRSRSGRVERDQKPGER